VRVAVALATGQAALCAVIGWVTFGSPDPAPSRATRPVAPPIVMPTAGMGLPVSAAPVLTTSAVRSRPKTSTRAPKPPRPATTPSARVTTTTAPRPLVAPSQHSTGPVTLPTTGDPATSPTPTPSEVQEGVVPGEPCDPPGAVGRTIDDVEVHCKRAGDIAIWQIN
jgi:hypothetical protein